MVQSWFDSSRTSPGYSRKHRIDGEAPHSFSMAQFGQCSPIRWQHRVCHMSLFAMAWRTPLLWPTVPVLSRLISINDGLVGQMLALGMIAKHQSIRGGDEAWRLYRLRHLWLLITAALIFSSCLTYLIKNYNKFLEKKPIARFDPIFSSNQIIHTDLVTSEP